MSLVTVKSSLRRGGRGEEGGRHGGQEEGSHDTRLDLTCSIDLILHYQGNQTWEGGGREWADLQY